MKNWVYYMREGIKNLWKKKVVPDYRTVTDEVKFNKEGRVPKGHPFRDREFDGAFKEPYKDAVKKWRKKDAIELLEEIDPQVRDDENENN